MNGMYLIGWLVAVILRTLVPFWQEHKKDGRKWDWDYISPAIFSAFAGALAQMPVIQNDLNVPQEGVSAFFAGLMSGLAMQEVGNRFKKAVG